MATVTEQSTLVQEVLTANEQYVDNFGDKGSSPLPPGRGFVILTCMDARLDPAKYAGLAEGDAHVYPQRRRPGQPKRRTVTMPFARW